MMQDTSPSIYHLFLFPFPLWMAHRTESWPLLLSSQNNKQTFIKTPMSTLHLQAQMGLLIAFLIRFLDRPFIEYDDSSWWYWPATCFIDCSLSKVRSIEPCDSGPSESEDSVSDSPVEDSADWSSEPLLPSPRSFLRQTQPLDIAITCTLLDTDTLAKTQGANRTLGWRFWIRWLISSQSGGISQAIRVCIISPKNRHC